MKKYVCRECGAPASNAKDLTKHILQRHQTIRRPKKRHGPDGWVKIGEGRWGGLGNDLRPWVAWTL